jgi:hypothetical protein
MTEQGFRIDILSHSSRKNEQAAQCDAIQVRSVCKGGNVQVNHQTIQLSGGDDTEEVKRVDTYMS